jgi:excisionase family DNA binding protein
VATESLEALAYTRRSAAAAVGVPGKTIDLAIETGELPAIRSGRRLVILKSDLLAWLHRCKTRGVIPARVTDDDRQRLALLNRERRGAS